MKIPIILEVLAISILISFVSAKSVEKTGRDAAVEVTTLKSNVSLSKVTGGTRQDLVVQDNVEIVQNLADSQEIAASPLEGEVIVNDAVSGEKPVSVESNDVVETNKPVEKPVNENDPNPINKYCSCSSSTCKCCRDFLIPLIPIRGPGCATVRYLNDDRLSISIKYGDLVLASRQVDSRRPTPICLPLPGGYNRFCGRIYGISRQEDNFKACLGLELRADDDVEASLRVSCFKFGPKGLATMEAEPLPVTFNESSDEDDDDDDDDDDDPLGLEDLAGGGDDDDDDYDSDEAPAGPAGFIGNVLGGVLGGGAAEEDDDFFEGFGFLRSASDFITDFLGGDSGQNKKKKPNETIQINSKSNEKTKKKSEVVKKNAKNAASKLKAEADDEPTEVLDKDEEAEVTEKATTKDDDEYSDEEKDEKKESLKEDEGHEDEDEDNEDETDDYEDEEDEDDEYDEKNEVKDDEKKKTHSKTTETKPAKKKKKASNSYGFDFLGRFYNLFNGE